MGFHKSRFYYRARPCDDAEVEEAVRSASEFGDGFWKIYQRLRRDGHEWNHKKVYRIYKKLHMEKRSKIRKRLPDRVKNPLASPEMPCQTWSMDFVSDKLDNGRSFRVLNIIDDCTREAVAMEISMSMPAARVIKTLEKVMWLVGKPQRIRTDNGPEFISKELEAWCQGNNIEHIFTQPGCPTQNSYVERFNGSYRRAVLNAYIFPSLEQVRELTQAWMTDYNEVRPHEALGNLTPKEYHDLLVA